MELLFRGRMQRLTPFLLSVRAATRASYERPAPGNYLALAGPWRQLLEHKPQLPTEQGGDERGFVRGSTVLSSAFGLFWEAAFVARGGL